LDQKEVNREVALKKKKRLTGGTQCISALMLQQSLRIGNTIWIDSELTFFSMKNAVDFSEE